MQASPRDDAAAAIDRATLAGAYFLLADLLEWGPTASLRNAGATSPILAEAMAENGQEELEASHTAVFGLQVFPYAGVFLDPSAQVGAGSTSLQSLFRELGFDPGRSDSGVDHLATLFRALGHASAREASLPGGRECATPLRRCTRDLLDRHVLTWIPPWRSAVRRMEETWPTALAAQCVVQESHLIKSESSLLCRLPADNRSHRLT